MAYKSKIQTQMKRAIMNKKDSKPAEKSPPTQSSKEAKPAKGLGGRPLRPNTAGPTSKAPKPSMLKGIPVRDLKPSMTTGGMVKAPKPHMTEKPGVAFGPGMGWKSGASLAPEIRWKPGTAEKTTTGEKGTPASGGAAEKELPETLGAALEKSPNGVKELTGKEESGQLLGELLETGQDGVKELTGKGKRAAEGSMELLGELLVKGPDAVKSQAGRDKDTAEGTVALLEKLQEKDPEVLKNLAGKGGRSAEGIQALLETMQKKDPEGLKNLAGKELKAAEVTKGQAGSKEEKSGGILEWLGEKAKPLISPGLGVAAGLADYVIARAAGALTLPALALDVISFLDGKGTGHIKAVNDTAVDASGWVSDKLSGYAKDQEAYYNSKYMTDIIGEAELISEAIATGVGALVTLIGGVGGGAALAPATGGASILVVSGGALAVAEGLAVDAAWAGISAGIMNSIVENNGWNAKGDSGAEKSVRDQLLEEVENPKLKNAVNEIYRPGAEVGDGGLADAVRQELETGELVGGKSHMQKAMERIKNLENIINKQNLSSEDLKIANDLLNDLKDAVGGVE